MKTLYFKCTLLTDIILNQRAATEGNQETLDFIPGSNFLGIAASTLYKNASKESLALFHSQSVRFGDAHPVVVDPEGNFIRSIRIPAAYYRAKLGKPSGFYIYHEVENKDAPEYINFQPKQCRTGFYIFSGKELEEVSLDKSFAIKSAYDRVARRSKDKTMFGYEALQAGSTWVFDITLEDDSFEEKIREAFIGPPGENQIRKSKKRVGRSRTAQYGLVEIEEINNTVKTAETLERNPEYALVYADSRLIFLDKYGQATFQPSAADLGFGNGKIDWTKTQIRTFQYAPWNSKRQARDTERCGLEKGSVFFIRKEKGAEGLIYPEKSFIGNYQNEGFGKIIVNPSFLQPIQNSNGKALFSLAKAEDTSTQQEDTGTPSIPEITNPLFLFLMNKKEEAGKEKLIYQLVNEFVDNPKNQKAFAGEAFSSQWGGIRNIAMQASGYSDLDRLLFNKETGYLVTGIMQEKWSEKGRLSLFKKFLNKIAERPELSNEDACAAIINLSAEMAKFKERKQI